MNIILSKVQSKINYLQNKRPFFINSSFTDSSALYNNMFVLLFCFCMPLYARRILAKPDNESIMIAFAKFVKMSSEEIVSNHPPPPPPSEIFAKIEGGGGDWEATQNSL